MVGARMIFKVQFENKTYSGKIAIKIGSQWF